MATFMIIATMTNNRVYANSFTWPLLLQLLYEFVDVEGRHGEPQIYIFEVAAYMLFPLQGWFNFLVFISPRYRLWRMALPEESMWYVFRRAVGKETPPTRPSQRRRSQEQLRHLYRNEEHHPSHRDASRVGMTDLSNASTSANKVMGMRWHDYNRHRRSSQSNSHGHGGNAQNRLRQQQPHRVATLTANDPSMTPISMTTVSSISHNREEIIHVRRLQAPASPDESSNLHSINDPKRNERENALLDENDAEEAGSMEPHVRSTRESMESHAVGAVPYE
eukprot:CAMPEP_0198112582 /NCGR_PEP_ID=MMETSP1442-20131203/4412_1 /TAXON_ID= /ORGANISM="Craspedostauros australis, Strain CCMP3328" /LENGTH=277 /DNA_ID=CAMNT_0043769401 /DNA_START=8 /DNA_END=842 /DNA_ORIENTATION=+